MPPLYAKRVTLSDSHAVDMESLRVVVDNFGLLLHEAVDALEPAEYERLAAASVVARAAFAALSADAIGIEFTVVPNA